MKKDIIGTITDDFLFINEIIFRRLRKNVVRFSLKNITPLHHEIMRTIDRLGKLQPAEISDRLQISRPQMTRLIDRLIEQDLVKRQPGESDRRTVMLTLTDKGKMNLKENYALLKKALKDTLSALSDEDVMDILNSFQKLRNVFSKLGMITGLEY